MAYTFQMNKDIAFIMEKLEMSKEIFDKLMNEVPKQHSEYKHSILIRFAGLARIFRKVLSD